MDNDVRELVAIDQNVELHDVYGYTCNRCKKPESEVGYLSHGRCKNGLDWQLCDKCESKIIEEALSRPQVDINSVVEKVKSFIARYERNACAHEGDKLEIAYDVARDRMETVLSLLQPKDGE